MARSLLRKDDCSQFILQQVDHATAPEAVEALLCAMPGVVLSQQEASTLRLCGSLKDLSKCSASDIAGLTGIENDRSCSPSRIPELEPLNSRDYGDIFSVAPSVETA